MVKEMVDGRPQDGAPVFLEELGPIRPAAEKADSEWGLRNDHGEILVRRAPWAGKCSGYLAEL
jgi:hypothetical protein